MKGMEGRAEWTEGNGSWKCSFSMQPNFDVSLDAAVALWSIRSLIKVPDVHVAPSSTQLCFLPHWLELEYMYLNFSDKEDRERWREVNFNFWFMHGEKGG